LFGCPGLLSEESSGELRVMLRQVYYEGELKKMVNLSWDLMNARGSQEDAGIYLSVLLDHSNTLDKERQLETLLQIDVNVAEEFEDLKSFIYQNPVSLSTLKFTGISSISCTCRTCDSVTWGHTFTTFWTIPLPSSSSSSGGGGRRRRRDVVDLEKCAHDIFNEEIDDLCMKCYKSAQGNCSTLLPEILVFRIPRVDPFNCVNRSLVCFPLKGLSLKDMNGEYEYDLCGVVNRYGNAYGGHFTSIVKYGEDDSSVSKHKLDSSSFIESADAFLLFYSRVKEHSTQYAEQERQSKQMFQNSRNFE
jgi:ubiquitin C-terminal hydrolase